MASLIRPVDNVISRNKQSQGRLSRIRFPSDIGPFSMVFNIKKYKFNTESNVNMLITDSIVLPIPQALQDNMSISLSYSGIGFTSSMVADITSQDSLADFGRNIGTNLDPGIREGVNNLINSDSGTVFEKTANVARFLSKNGFASLPGIGSIESGISAGTGVAINPHATLVFDGVSMKSHSLDWTLSPASQEESDSIKDIIKAFRRSALPSYRSASGYTSHTGTSFDRAQFEYPDMLDIFFTGLDPEHYYHFKTTMINSVAVNYSTQGNAFLKGDKGVRPMSVNLVLQLIETDIHTKEDYT